MSAGLAGATEQSKRAFVDVISSPVDRPWADEIKRRSIELMRCLELDGGFETEVLDTVRRARGGAAGTFSSSNGAWNAFH